MTRVSSIFFWFGMAIVTSLLLYHTSDRAQTLNAQLRSLNAAIEGERESIHVLNAEWAYLSTPARIERLARKYTALKPTATQQVVAISEVAEILPTRAEAMASVAVNAAPIANVGATLASVMPTPRVRVIHTAAQAKSGHLSDHMIIERSASAEPPKDSIGTLIASLGAHP
jgi:cell division protein FtsL